MQDIHSHRTGYQRSALATLSTEVLVAYLNEGISGKGRRLTAISIGRSNSRLEDWPLLELNGAIRSHKPDHDTSPSYLRLCLFPMAKPRPRDGCSSPFILES